MSAAGQGKGDAAAGGDDTDTHAAENQRQVVAKLGHTMVAAVRGFDADKLAAILGKITQLPSPGLPPKWVGRAIAAASAEGNADAIVSVVAAVGPQWWSLAEAATAGAVCLSHIVAGKFAGAAGGPAATLRMLDLVMSELEVTCESAAFEAVLFPSRFDASLPMAGLDPPTSADQVFDRLGFLTPLHWCAALDRPEMVASLAPWQAAAGASAGIDALGGGMTALSVRVAVAVLSFVRACVRARVCVCVCA